VRVERDARSSMPGRVMMLITLGQALLAKHRSL
jgi:hypothetical protein